MARAKGLKWCLRKDGVLCAYHGVHSVGGVHIDGGTYFRKESAEKYAIHWWYRSWNGRHMESDSVDSLKEAVASIQSEHLKYLLDGGE